MILSKSAPLAVLMESGIHQGTTKKEYDADKDQSLGAVSAGILANVSGLLRKHF